MQDNNIRQVNYFLIYPLKSKIIEEEKWNKCERDEDKTRIFKCEYLRKNNLIYYKILFGDETFWFVVYQQSLNYPFNVKEKSDEMWKDFHRNVDNNLLNKNFKYRFIDIEISSYSEISPDILKEAKLIFFESENLTTSNLKFEEFSSEKRKTFSSNIGVLQIRSHQQEDKELYKRLTDILKALTLKIYYTNIAQELSQHIRNSNKIDIINLREKLIEADAERFYRNIVKSTQVDRYEFWENLIKALKINEERELTIQQTNMVGDIIKQKVKEEENRIATERNFILAILGIIIGITGANFLPIQQSLPFYTLSNEIIKLTTAIMPLIVMYFLGWIVFKSKKNYIIKFFYLLFFLFIGLILGQNYLEFLVDYGNEIWGKLKKIMMKF